MYLILYQPLSSNFSTQCMIVIILLALTNFMKAL